MTGRDFRHVAIALLLSLLAGIGVWIFGTVGRVPPQAIDSIWRSVDEIRGEVAGKLLVLKEKEKVERSFLEYRVALVRLANEPPAIERYLLTYRPAYRYVFSSDWKPSAWDLAIIAYETPEGGGRRAEVVVGKRVKE
ncbi:MAG: hypothetical protein V1495_06220 [Pseudomonadota bacterium]